MADSKSGNFHLNFYKIFPLRSIRISFHLRLNLVNFGYFYTVNSWGLCASLNFNRQNYKELLPCPTSISLHEIKKTLNRFYHKKYFLIENECKIGLPFIFYQKYFLW